MSEKIEGLLSADERSRYSSIGSAVRSTHERCDIFLSSHSAGVIKNLVSKMGKHEDLHRGDRLPGTQGTSKLSGYLRKAPIPSLQRKGTALFRCGETAKKAHF